MGWGLNPELCTSAKLSRYLTTELLIYISPDIIFFVNAFGSHSVYTMTFEFTEDCSLIRK
jgi:hypothetical protein